jgi:TolB-like protein
MSFLAELKRRRVVRVALVYGAVAFAGIQGADVIFPRIPLPDWTVRLVVWLAILGLPVALALSWAFELTPDGVRRTEDVATPPGSSGVAWVSPRTIIVAMLALIAAVAAGWLARGPERAAGADLSSIAVLPFANLGGSQEDDYFSDGLAEELLNVLGRIDGLKVSARTSAFAFKGKNLDVRAIGDSLDVGTVLEGSVRREGHNVRITAKLSSVADGYQLWSDQFDTQSGNLIQLQEQIARAIADALQIKLRRADALALGGTTNPVAHDNYLLGLSKFSQRGAAPLREALQYFERAVAADSNYAQAWGGIAMVNAVLPPFEAVDPAIAGPLTRKAAERAIALDSTIAEPYAALCQSLTLNEWRWAEAERACDAAIARNPNFATAHQWRGELLHVLGRFDESKAALVRALERDPRSLIGQVIAAWVAYDRGDTATVINALATARALDPTPLTRYLSVTMLLSIGDTATARVVLGELQVPAETIEHLVHRLRDPGARDEVLRYLDPPAGQTGDMVRATNRGLVGDPVAAIPYLEKAFRNHEYNLPLAMRSADLAPIRDHPRFRRILEDMGLEPYFPPAR